MAKSPPPSIGRKYIIKNPFMGLIFCGECGRVMSLGHRNNGICCILCRTRTCDNVSSEFGLIEARILAALKDWLSEHKILWGSCEDKPDNGIELKKRAIKRIESEISALKTQLSGMHDLLERGAYTVDVFLDRSRSVSERTKASEQNLSALKRELSIEVAREKNRHKLLPKVEDLLEVYGRLPTAAAKNDLLKEVIEKIVYLKTVKGNHRYPENKGKFEITIYPKLPHG
jgi:hypothetical protein